MTNIILIIINNEQWQKQKYTFKIIDYKNIDLYDTITVTTHNFNIG